ncbi:MAG TPA: hypothetical protein ENI50_02510 [Euryarchaeota archaeon]|nr:MAG: hypothetical protein DRN45_04590 [Thermococci archaeon]HEC95875.1 hypothetical protein [Euryarchaeota archaeon]
MSKVDQITEYLQNYIVQDTTVPRNIRKAASDAIKFLKEKDKENKVKAYSAIEVLDGVSNDPNMPMHARTIIWEVLSELEKVE